MIGPKVVQRRPPNSRTAAPGLMKMVCHCPLLVPRHCDCCETIEARLMLGTSMSSSIGCRLPNSGSSDGPSQRRSRRGKIGPTSLLCSKSRDEAGRPESRVQSAASGCTRKQMVLGRSAGHWKLLLKASFQWPGARGTVHRSDGAATLAITGQGGQPGQAVRHRPPRSDNHWHRLDDRRGDRMLSAPA